MKYPEVVAFLEVGCVVVMNMIVKLQYEPEGTSRVQSLENRYNSLKGTIRASKLKGCRQPNSERNRDKRITLITLSSERWAETLPRSLALVHCTVPVGPQPADPYTRVSFIPTFNKYILSTCYMSDTWLLAADRLIKHNPDSLQIRREIILCHNCKRKSL